MTINGVNFTNIPNKKLGLQMSLGLTQTNIQEQETVEEYLQSERFYKLLHAIDIDWDGMEVAPNVIINDTSDFINWLLTLPTKGDKGDPGPQGPKGDTGTFDASDLENYVTIEQYNALLERVVALENGSGGGGNEEPEEYLTPVTTKPTAQDIANIDFPESEPEEPQSLETSEVGRPTELYLTYPSSWITANANGDITNPVITDSNGFEQGAWVDSTVTIDGVEYTIIGTELGKDNYTITFN